MTKSHRTDLVIYSQSRERKIQSYSQIDRVKYKQASETELADLCVYSYMQQINMGVQYTRCISNKTTVMQTSEVLLVPEA